MKYISVKKQKLSRMALGTVQLGMNYGIIGKGKPSEKEAFALLDKGMELGVNSLDTANDYGDSQAIIGRWLKERRLNGEKLPWIVTKIGAFRDESFDRLRDDVLYQAEACRKELGVETIDCLMLHDFEDYDKNRDSLRKIFEELKKDQVCQYSAISAYSRHDYGVIAESGFDGTQIPLNIFDWTQIDNGGIEKLEKAGMMVFVRSVFLQGLIFLGPQEVDPRMDFAVPYVKEFCRLCQEFELKPAVLALSFVFSLPGITQVVLGCERVEQVVANCSLIEKTVKLTEEQMDAIHKVFRNTDPRVLNPGVWFNHT